MAAGSIDVHGYAGPHAGGAAPGAQRGMTGGELIIRGSAGDEGGSRMRRGLVVVGGDAGAGAGLRDAGRNGHRVRNCGRRRPGLWSKRGSIVALGAVTLPATYRTPARIGRRICRLIARAPAHAGTVSGRRRDHLAGAYRRYSGDLAELGEGEILAWTAQ